MYVCMYVCIYVCMYVCMFVCMFVCMHACMYVCMYVCMYIYIYIYVCVCVIITIRCTVLHVMQCLVHLCLGFRLCAELCHATHVALMRKCLRHVHAVLVTSSVSVLLLPATWR